jgi:antitoxin component YwqK of YwqJK toxin-antitoxin module
VDKKMNDLEIAEIPYDSGVIRFRYSRYLASDGSRWVRHGLFRAYHENLASEGNYVDGLEQGDWIDYHDNGAVAAKGAYDKGLEVGEWVFWNADGTRQA